MTLTLTLSPEKETRLQRQASSAGLPVAEYLFLLADQAASIDEDEHGARISDTRIKVRQIAAESTRQKMTPEQIAEAHPHLTLPQIYTALLFYYLRKDDIDAQIDASVAEYDQARANAGESPFVARMRAEGRLPRPDRAA